MKIAVEGIGANPANTYNALPGMPSRQTVLLDLAEAEKLYNELHKIFGYKKPVGIQGLPPLSVPEISPPKIDLPPLRPDPIPGQERQKTIADFVRDMVKDKTPLPHKPFDTWPNPYAPTFPYYCPPPSPLNPGLPGIQYGSTCDSGVICSFNPDLPQNSPPYGSFGPERN